MIRWLFLWLWRIHAIMMHPMGQGPIRKVVITLKGSNVADVAPGGVIHFEVQCFNNGGKRIMPTDATVAVNPTTLGTDSVNADGSSGVFTAGSAEGTGEITARAAGIDATPLPVNVVDNTITRVTIVPLP